MKLNNKCKRIKDTGVSFTNGIIDGWIFDVPRAFLPTLDIVCFNYVNKAKTAELRRAEGGKKSSRRQPLTVYQKIWTRRVPPVRSFKEGHVFYDPIGVRQMVWRDALKILRRVVQVHEAKPDTRSGSEGWVSFSIYYYEDGQVVAAEEKMCLQGDFEAFLRNGKLAVS